MASTDANGKPLFRFQYKGLYPALEEAARLSPAMRGQLDHLVGDVECSVCGGSRLNTLAAAVRLRDRTIGEICRVPLAKLLEEFAAWKPSGGEKKIAGDLLRRNLQSAGIFGRRGLGISHAFTARSKLFLVAKPNAFRLASQIGSGLCGVLYVLDEPTHRPAPRDNRRLLGALQKLRDLGKHAADRGTR